MVGSMVNSIFKAPIDLRKHTSLIYAEGVFGLGARKKFPMRAKTADGILRYANYKIAGVVDLEAYTPLSLLRRGEGGEVKAGDILPAYLTGSKNFNAPIFQSIREAKGVTNADVLIIGSAPEGGDLPDDYKNDIAWAIKNKMHIVSGTHYALNEDSKFLKLSKKYKTILWDARKFSHTEDVDKIPVGSLQVYHIKKPIVLTVGMDAAIGKMTVGYEMHKAAQALGARSIVIPTGQTTIMIEGWGAAIDALPADFMAGAVEKMLLDVQNTADVFFVEGQGSLFHPAYANTCISLIHGAVPSHIVLVHRPQRKHSIGSKLVKLPDVKSAIRYYENSVLPSYRNTKVIGVALNTDGLSSRDAEASKKEMSKQCGLPVFDALRDKDAVTKIVKSIL